jgi:hypothetical protein
VADTIRDNTAALWAIQTAVGQNSTAVERPADGAERLDGREGCFSVSQTEKLRN